MLAHRHPERFSELTNRSLACPSCRERLCHHERQLHGFWVKNRDILLVKGNPPLGFQPVKKP